jgi:hypothetical protein
VSAFCPTNTIRATSESERLRNDADIELKATGRWATTCTRIQCCGRDKNRPGLTSTSPATRASRKVWEPHAGDHDYWLCP